jgi:hypothetical protein
LLPGTGEEEESVINEESDPESGSAIAEELPPSDPVLPEVEKRKA